ncbi:MAG: hypothetical protein IIA87_02525 [Nanoarchaeota archaeon]|nr:hypothetical protein [Nanoarchaeota archaeon]
MRKKQKNSRRLFIPLVIIIIVGLVIIFILNDNEIESTEESAVSIGDSNFIQDEFPNAEGLHWGHMPVTYFFSREACGVKQEKRIIDAFNILEERTEGIVSFKELESVSEVNIYIICIEKSQKSIAEELDRTGGVRRYVAYYYNISNIITEAGITFFLGPGKIPHRDCNLFPDEEIRNILLASGFELTNKTTNPTNETNHILSENLRPRRCPYEVNEDIVDKLIDTYSE